ncbi:outer membrane protein assembly factor BamB family protein [Hamadaea tsunoensis]|uniref:outer membrane protein assembly factor BamB family protein n=1 Tax=Hamadaea tsunoensis TaxID=53368 RepID=UPI00041C5CA4|nr:PQQ-binding-like beta-propeller repeat protein [Hamadaea tsunoensis]
MAQLPRRTVLTGAAATAVGATLLPGTAGAAPADDRSCAPAVPDPVAAATRDFPKVGGNYGNQNYTALRDVHHGNIHRLGGAWLNRIEGGITTGTNQSTAVAVDGVLYIESAYGNVFAVDGKTGVTKWVYRQTRGTLTRRGVAVGDGLVFTHGKGSWIIALDQQTGAVAWEKQITGYGGMEKVAVTHYDGLLYVGTHDSDRNAALALDAHTGDVVWHFWGAPGPGEIGNDTWEGTSWQTGGAAPWMHPAVDPELGLVYWAFGNARGSKSSQDGSQRGGQNLFSSALVAMDLKTGQYRWHFQSIHHGIWDMDNTMAPVLVDTKIHGRTRKLVVYGSKSGMYFILDRTDGTAPLGIDEVPVPQEPRQKTWPTQPFPRQGPWTENRVVDQPLGTDVPGDPNRAVPNYVQGALYDPHWDIPILTIPGHGGGADWAHQSFSHSTGFMYTGYGYVAAAHSLTEASNGLRPPGEYQTGGVVAVDASTNKVAWKRRLPYSVAHGNGVLTTAGDLLFIGQPDGYLLALDARHGHELWRFQCGASISSSPISYEIDGEQYIAVYAGGTGIPYGDSAPRGDFLWAFKLGGTVAPAAVPTPPVVRRPVSGGPVEGSVVNNTVILARTYNAATNTVGTVESTAVNAMAPTHLRVPVGTTVTFTNPADNANVHGATQFFEGLFDVRLQPGESFTYTFTTKGEYFFNDSFSPRPTGKVEVY